MPEQDDNVDTSRPAGPAPDEPRAHELLPPDAPPEGPEPRRIAERRVVGWDTCSRLHERRVRRPVGNSRTFWKRIEDDDPFLPRPVLPRAAQVAHDQLYPAERLERIPESQRAPRAAQPAAQPKPPPRPQQPPKPQQPPRQPAPEQVHTPESRAMPTPRQQPAPPEAERRLPPRAPNPEIPGRSKPSSGRLRVNTPRAAPPPPAPSEPVPDRSPADIRAEKKETRAFGAAPPPPPKARGIDEILGMLGELKMAEDMYNAGVTGETNTDIVDTPAPVFRAPTPQPEPEPPPPRPAPRPAPAAAKPQAPVEPPRPAPPRPTPPTPEPAPPPSAPAGPPASAGSLDDLFGGGGSAQDTRVRIGRRSVPKGPKIEEKKD